MSIVKYANLFASHTPWYGICVGIGLFAIGMWMLFLFKTLRLSEDKQNEILCGFPFMLATGVLFAFLLDALFTGNWRTWALSDGRRYGFTFTGWLLGTVVFIAAYAGHTSFTRRFLFDMLLPSFALAQGFGRIGCFLGGCCYGRVCSWGVHYPPGSLPYEQMGAAALFPVQLVEAILLFCLFYMCVRRPFEGRGSFYLIGVGAIRFALEFFRADNRGSFLGLTVISPQQIMSLLFAAIGVLLLVSSRKGNIHVAVSNVRMDKLGCGGKNKKGSRDEM